MGKSHGMFDLPDAKRARIESSDESDEEVLSSGASSDGQDDDEAIRSRLRAQIERVLSVDDGAAAAAAAATALPDGDTGDAGDHPVEEAFEFRLFASSAKGGAAAPPQKVVLVPDDLDAAVAGEGAFVVPSRPLTYYLPGDPTPQETDMFRAAAVSGEDILLRSGQRCWGLEVPWRVTKVTVTRKEMRALVANGPPEDDVVALPDGSDEDEDVAAAEAQNRKPRPGKKRRIALRTKERALQAAEKRRKEKLDVEEKLRVSKEEHLREKNKRLNREKKLKRRQKERDKKSASKAALLGEVSAPPVETAI